MSEIAQHVLSPTASLELRPTQDLPRWLRLTAWTNGDVQVAVCAPKNRRGPHLSFAFAEIRRCRIVRDADGFCLWIGSAAFDITEIDAAQIRRAIALTEVAL
jgi:hypothetical protein